MLVLLMSVSCKNDDDPAKASIVNSWKLISMTSTVDNQIIVVPKELNYLTITFKDSSKVIATSVCNPGNGNYFVKGDSIKITIGFFQMECLKDTIYPDLDTKFESNLNLVQKFSISDDNLTLISKGSCNLSFTLIK